MHYGWLTVILWVQPHMIIHSTIHCHLQSAWPSPSFCAGRLPQRFHTALVLGPYGQSEWQPEQQLHHPEGKGAKEHCDCDTHYLGRQDPLPLTSCGWVVHFNILFLNTIAYSTDSSTVELIHCIAESTWVCQWIKPIMIIQQRTMN